MSRIAAPLLSMVCLVCCVLHGQSQSPHQKCPVDVSHVQLSYNHAEGSSRPQLTVKFANQSKTLVSTVKVALYLLDADGTPRLYPDSFEYDDGLEIGKTRVFTWDLDFASVDIHRTGETVVVEKIEFADASTWNDDGSESCSFTVDYHPR